MNMADNDKYSRLAELIKELKQITSSTTTSNINYALVNTIDALLVIVQEKIQDKQNTVDDTVIEILTEFEENIFKVYLDQLTELLTELQVSLAALNEDYEKNVTLLESSENESAKAVLSMLESYTATKKAQMATVSTFGTGETFKIQEDYLRLPYGVIAVLNVWPKYMQRDFVTCTNDLHKSILDVINNPAETDSLVVSDSFYTLRPTGALRQILVNAANLTAFQELFKQAKEKMTVKVQNLSRQEFINQLGSLTTNSPALQTAISAILSENDDKLAVVRQILAKFNDKPTVSEKQLLVKDLEVAVNEAIKADTTLFNICATLLCPSILAFDTVLPEASADTDFYGELASYIDDQLTDNENGILTLINLDDGFVFNVLEKFDKIYEYLYETRLIIDELHNAITTDDISKFNYWEVIANAVSDIENYETSIPLTVDYLKRIYELRLILDVQEQIKAIK